MDAIADSKPSFYEITMQDRLNDMLWQSVRHLVSTLLDKTPSLTPFRYYSYEISSFLCALLDLYSLLTTKGTFSENFYSLCRNISSKSSIFSYLFLHYFLPCFIKFPLPGQIYSFFKGLTMLSFLYFKYAYYSPEFAILKQELIRQKSKYRMGIAFIGLLLLLKVIEMFFTSKKGTKEAVAIKNIQPPYKDSVVGKGICPICKEKFVNPTALSSSGYVFCYTCIRQHLQVFNACPVTNVRSSLRNMRKIHVYEGVLYSY